VATLRGPECGSASGRGENIGCAAWRQSTRHPREGSARGRHRPLGAALLRHEALTKGSRGVASGPRGRAFEVRERLQSTPTVACTDIRARFRGSEAVNLTQSARGDRSCRTPDFAVVAGKEPASPTFPGGVGEARTTWPGGWIWGGREVEFCSRFRQPRFFKSSIDRRLHSALASVRQVPRAGRRLRAIDKKVGDARHPDPSCTSVISHLA
jgi:hypothetical protein